jgi:hypothetical protein
MRTRAARICKESGVCVGRSQPDSPTRSPTVANFLAAGLVLPGATWYYLVLPGTTWYYLANAADPVAKPAQELDPRPGRLPGCAAPGCRLRGCVPQIGPRGR